MRKQFSWALQGLFIGCLFMLSACRFGNYSEPPTSTTPNMFKSAELFFTEVKQLEATVLFADGTGQTNANAPLVAVPVLLLATFSNPVYWLTRTDPTAPQVFAETNLTYFKSTIVDANGHIDPNVVTYDPHAQIFGKPSVAYQFWNNANCATLIQETQEGDFDRTTPGTTVLPDQTQANVSGHLKLKFTHVQVWDGDCSDDLQELANCYQDGTGCTDQQLINAHEVFDEYVKQTGILDITKASQVRGLEYIAHFE